MALATADIHVKVDPAIKKRAEKKFKKDGITMSDFVNIKLRGYLRGDNIFPQRNEAELPENLRITTREELEAFLDKRLAENEEKNQYYTVDQIREELVTNERGSINE